MGDDRSNRRLQRLAIPPAVQHCMSERRRLAVLCFHTSPLVQPGGRDAGGMNVYVRESALQLAKLGYAVDIFTRASGRAPVVQELAPSVRLIQVIAGPRRAVTKQRLPEYITDFVHGVARFRIQQGLRYELIQSHYWLSGMAGLQLARRWDVPHVTMFHTLGEVKNRARLGEREPASRVAGELAVVRDADRIVCATDHDRGLLHSLYGAPEAKLTTVPCGVDADLFKPMPQAVARRRLGLGDDGILLFVGRIEPLKGLHIVIDALAQLDRPRPLLLVVGGDRHSSTEMRRLTAQADAAGVGDRVRLVGAAPQQELPLYYAAADVTVVPSYYESFGMVALEAQACGTPVVASRVGGLPGVVRDGETGYLVPWRCPQPFAEQLDLLLRNDALRESFGRNARQWAVQFRWQEIAQRISNMYDAVRAEQSPAESCHPSRCRWTKATHQGCAVA